MELTWEAMVKRRKAVERNGPAIRPARPVDRADAQPLSDRNGATTSAASRVLDILSLLGLSEADLYDELSKRRDPSAPHGESSGRDKTPTKAQMPQVRNERVRRVLEMIESQQGQSVQYLARLAGASPDHLQRLFKQETGGRHLGELLSERRLRRAAELLFNSDMSIKEIAYAVGYKHHSSFVRAFERQFGETPREYRRENGRPPDGGAKGQSAKY